ncbi:Cloroperoxidase, partial [Dendrothele bispora CBS 962.96]
NNSIDWNAHKWLAPSSTDSRGPCPGLNTLANHGFLPRNGKNITVEMILDAIHQGFNVDPTSDVIRLAAKLGLLTTDNLAMSLEELALHGTLEHDVSLSRSDVFPDGSGDNIHFNETVFTTLAQANPGSDVYNVTSAAATMDIRLALDKIENPGLTNTVKEFFIRAVESSFYLSVMGDPIKGVAKKEFVQIFFREERLPIAEGWTRPTSLITTDLLGNLVGQIQESSHW